MEEKLPPGVSRIAEEHWEIRVRVRSVHTGRRMSAKRRVRGNLETAVAERLKLIEELRNDKGGGRQERMTVGAYALSWLDRKRMRGAKHSSIATRTSVLERHILPEWADWYVDAVRRRDVEEWLARCADLTSPRTDKPYAPRTINSWLSLLQTLVRSAYRDLELGSSPLREIEPLPVPRRKRDNPNSLSAEQLAAFLAELQRSERDHWALAFIGFTTGLRWGEITELRWDDIDEAAGVIEVTRAQWQGVVSEPKTESSIRVIALVPEQLRALRAHRRRLVAQQHPGLASDLVFPARRGGQRKNPEVTSRAFERAAARIGLPFSVTSHAMRRTFNNLLRRAGIGKIVLHSLTGHSSDAMTEVYSTVGTSEQAQAVGRVVEIARGGAGGSGPRIGPTEDEQTGERRQTGAEGDA